MSTIRYKLIDGRKVLTHTHNTAIPNVLNPVAMVPYEVSGTTGKGKYKSAFSEKGFTCPKCFVIYKI